MSKKPRHYYFSFSTMVSLFRLAGTSEMAFVGIPNVGAWKKEGIIEFQSPGGTLHLKMKTRRRLRKRVKKGGVNAHFRRRNGDAKFIAPRKHASTIISELGTIDSSVYVNGVEHNLRRELIEELGCSEYRSTPRLVRLLTGKSPKKLKPILDEEQVQQLKFSFVRNETRLTHCPRLYGRRLAFLHRYLFLFRAEVPTRKMFDRLVDHPLTIVSDEGHFLHKALKSGHKVQVRFGY